MATDPVHVAPNELITSAWGNSVVDIIGPVSTLTPVGGSDSVKDHLHAAKSADVNHDNRLNSLDARANEEAFRHYDADGYYGVVHPFVINQAQIVTTNAGGHAYVTFPVGFYAYSAPVVCNGDQATAWIIGVLAAGASGAGFNIHVVWPDSYNPVANMALRVHYVAMGRYA